MPAAGFCAAQTAPCNEARLNLAEQTGSLKRREPGPGRATGSQPKKDEPPTVSHPRGAERCFAHRTDADACLAIPA
jgi:hypothetical protein